MKINTLPLCKLVLHS